MFRITLMFNRNENFKFFIFSTTTELGRGTVDQCWRDLEESNIVWADWRNIYTNNGMDSSRHLASTLKPPYQLMVSGWPSKIFLKLRFWAHQIQFLASGNRYQNLKKLSDKLRHVECGISNCMFCLEWRCGKFIEFQKNKLIEEAENENRAGFINLISTVNIYDVCSNWISINQFLNNWFLPGIRWEVLIFYEQLPTVS